jgi:predicted transcriptional regulator
MTQNENHQYLELTTEIVTAFVQCNHVAVTDLPELIKATYQVLTGLVHGDTPVTGAESAARQPPVPIGRSVQRNFIVCLEDGKKFKSLKRHLRTAYGLSPEEYREKWGLRPDYPMVAPGYSAIRSALAKASGLGNVRIRQGTPAYLTPPEEVPPENSPKTGVRRAGRARKTQGGATRASNME